MSEQQNKPQPAGSGGTEPPDAAPAGGKPALSGADLYGASATSKPSEEVGRQSGQQREHGHLDRTDQEQDGAATGSSGTDQVAGHPDTSAAAVRRGTNGGTG